MDKYYQKEFIILYIQLFSNFFLRYIQFLTFILDDIMQREEECSKVDIGNSDFTLTDHTGCNKHNIVTYKPLVKSLMTFFYCFILILLKCKLEFYFFLFFKQGLEFQKKIFLENGYCFTLDLHIVLIYVQKNLIVLQRL